MVRLPTVAKVTRGSSLGGRIVVFDPHPRQPVPGTVRYRTNMKHDVSMGAAWPAQGVPAARGTRIRFRVAALGTTLTMVTYLDRVSMGTIAPIVTQDWQLTP